MEAKCEVVGWLIVDADRAHVLVREEGGRISRQAARSESAPIHTGAFRRGNPIFDPVTSKLLGYEMEALNPMAPI